MPDLQTPRTQATGQDYRIRFRDSELDRRSTGSACVADSPRAVDATDPGDLCPELSTSGDPNESDSSRLASVRARWRPGDAVTVDCARLDPYELHVGDEFCLKGRCAIDSQSRMSLLAQSVSHAHW